MNEHMLALLSFRERLRVRTARLLLKRCKWLAPASWTRGRRIDGQVLDGDAEWLFQVRARAGGQPMNLLSPIEARRQDIVGKLVATKREEPIAEVRDLEIPTVAGALPARLYVPHDEQEGGGGMVYFHGGGFVLGSIDTHDASLRVLARASRTRILSVGYRLSPEYPFPAPIDDGVAAYAWAREHGESIGFDPERVAVGGDSVGGSLAAVVCHLLQAQGGVMPCFQLLIYPALDRVIERPSWTLFGEGLPLTLVLIDWFMEHYVQEGDVGDPRISPLHFARFEGLPPAHVAIAGFDLLRDEGLAYAERLEAAGVDVTVKLYDTLFHGFMQTAGVVPYSEVALVEIGKAMKSALHLDSMC